MALAARNGALTDLPGWAPANVNSHCPDDARNFHISRAHGLCIPPAQLRTPARKSSNGVQSPRLENCLSREPTWYPAIFLFGTASYFHRFWVQSNDGNSTDLRRLCVTHCSQNACEIQILSPVSALCRRAARLQPSCRRTSAVSAVE